MEKRLEAQIDVKLDWAVKQIQQYLRANHSIELVHKVDQSKGVCRNYVDAHQRHGVTESMDGRLEVIDQRLTAVAHKLGVGDSVRAIMHCTDCRSRCTRTEAYRHAGCIKKR